MLLTSSYLDMTTESSQSASNRAAASLHRMQRNKLNGGGVNTSLQSVVAANSEPHLSASNSTTNIMFDNRTGLSSTKGSINRLNRSYGSGIIGGANELTETVPDWATTTSFDDETRMNFSDVGEQSQQQPTTTTAALLILSKQRSSNHASNKQLTLDAKKSKPHHLDYVRHLRHNEELMKKTSSSNRDNKMSFLNTPQQQQRNWKVSSKKGEADLMSSLEAISAANSGGESSSKRSSKNSSSHHTLLIGGAVDGIVSSSENFATANNNQSSNSNLLESDSILMQMKKKSVINESKIRKLLKQKV